MNYMSADEAMSLVKSGNSVFFQGSTSVPVILQEALARRLAELWDVKILSGFNVTKGVAPFCKPEYKDSFVVNSLFLCEDQREYVAEGYGSLIPGFLSDISKLIRHREIPVDVACINCSPPDENGYCSYNIAADLTQPAVEAARIVIAQVNKNIPYLYGTAMIHEKAITAAVACDDPPIDLQFGEPTEIEIAIGTHIAAEIPDGATLQIGVGGIPNATLNGLRDHRHLGLHTEAKTDGVFRLMQSGVIDNSRKKYEPGRSVASLALGSREMYKFIDPNRVCVLFVGGVNNVPAISRQNPNAVAINSAIEVDLTGQICADSIGEKIFSSVGGQHDFMYGASLSEGGKTFIAMPSRTLGGHSKIVARLAPGAGVVTTRFQTQYVVTEYGCVYLRNKNLAERAKALISIAHPDDREALDRAAAERFGYIYHRLSMRP